MSLSLALASAAEEGKMRLIRTVVALRGAEQMAPLIRAGELIFCN